MQSDSQHLYCKGEIFLERIHAIIHDTPASSTDGRIIHFVRVILLNQRLHAKVLHESLSVGPKKKDGIEVREALKSIRVLGVSM